MGLDTGLKAEPRADRADHAWTGRMIAPETDAGANGRASFVTTSFDAPTGTSCSLRITAQGLYIAFVNGHRVGKDLLTPGWTCYDDRIAYQEYDISDLVQAGGNRIDIWLGDGWYRSPIMWRDTQVTNCLLL